MSKNNKVKQTQRENLHYKMYKARKTWLFANLFALATVNLDQGKVSTTTTLTNKLVTERCVTGYVSQLLTGTHLTNA